MQRKLVLLLIPFFIVVAVLFIVLLNFLGVPVYLISKEYCSCHYMIPNYSLFIFGILLILAAIPISYHFISKRLNKKLDEHMNTLLKFVGKKVDNQKKTSLVDKESFLKFLNTNERRILEKLLESKGDVLQSEISKMDNMTKLKTHRAVKNLKQKGIIKTQPHGKTKKIILTEEIKRSLNV